MKKIRCLLWDFDGTLYDTYPLMTKQVLQALKVCGVTELPTYEEVFAQMKVCLAHTCQLQGEKYGLEPKLLVDTFHEIQSRDQTLIPYEGTGECLKALKENGFVHYLYTHRGSTAPKCLQEDGLWQYFSDAVTSDDGFPAKPAPNAIHALLERNCIDPETAAMIGDRDIDIQAGHNAGIRSVLFDPGDYYLLLQTEYRVHSMKELMQSMLEQ